MNNEYFFDKYEEDAESMMMNVVRLRKRAAAWREIAELLMSRDERDNGLGRRKYAEMVEGN